MDISLDEFRQRIKRRAQHNRDVRASTVKMHIPSSIKALPDDEPTDKELAEIEEDE